MCAARNTPTQAYAHRAATARGAQGRPSLRSVRACARLARVRHGAARGAPPLLGPLRLHRLPH
eukprot:527700-Prymnesium_polylepis.1